MRGGVVKIWDLPQSNGDSEGFSLPPSTPSLREGTEGLVVEHEDKKGQNAIRYGNRFANDILQY